MLLALVLAAGGGCFSGDEGEQFYGRVSVPRAQEFRWSDGGLPRVFDPARASAPPDTDAVRALYEGLTELDPRTLEAVAGVAARWESAEGGRVWTFHLRGDARWSNGERVTARDFVRAWRRTLSLGEDAPHARLLSNLIEKDEPTPVGEAGRAQQAASSPGRAPSAGNNGRAQSASNNGRAQSASNAATGAAGAHGEAAGNSTVDESAAGSRSSGDVKLGAEALDDSTLRVRLRRPDQNFPALVAHPVFRPVHASAAGGVGARAGAAADSTTGDAGAQTFITNGAFRLSELAADRVVLERERHYWNAAQVALERVRFVGAADAEAALSAYRAGEVDAVTNANVEPLGLKLLAPYKDFRRTTFGALTYYDINATRPPFDDVRVRQALALAIDRQRLSADTLEGATVPAGKFLPEVGVDGATADEVDATTGDGAESDGGGDDAGARAETRRASDDEQTGLDEAGSGGGDDASAGGAGGEAAGAEKEAASRELKFDPQRARRLLAEAGYAGGNGFPRVRLLVNRNDQHRAVAEAVAAMWRSVLGVETEIMLRDWGEYELRLRAGEFDVAKRSLIMQTPDEEANILSMFDPERLNFDAATVAPETNGTNAPVPARAAPPTPPEVRAAAPAESKLIFTEAEALREMPAIPVYFASSFALVKPYVRGFETNLLDAPSLSRVRMETGWQPPKRDAAAAPASPAGR